MGLQQGGVQEEARGRGLRHRGVPGGGAAQLESFMDRPWLCAGGWVVPGSQTRLAIVRTAWPLRRCRFFGTSHLFFNTTFALSLPHSLEVAPTAHRRGALSLPLPCYSYVAFYPLPSPP